jgi:hypothetical protein
VTLWHIDDFKPLTEAIPRPLPWQVVGVLPTKDDYLANGDAVYSPHNCFCYTVSPGPTEVWCPMTSVEGRFCPPELITCVINIIFTAVGARQLVDGDNVVVPFEYTEPIRTGTTFGDGVFWIGHPVEDPDNSRFHCYRSPNTWVLPLRWSSPQGWDD